MSADPPQFEFSAGDNAEFLRLATKMRGVGFWFVVYGIAMILVFAFQLIPRNGRIDVEPLNLVTGLVFLFLGNRTRHAARSFHRIAETSGSDVTHLMQAVRALSRFYGLIDKLIFIVVILVILGVVLACAYLLLLTRMG